MDGLSLLAYLFRKRLAAQCETQQEEERKEGHGARGDRGARESPASQREMDGWMNDRRWQELGDCPAQMKLLRMKAAGGVGGGREEGDAETRSGGSVLGPVFDGSFGSSLRNHLSRSSFELSLSRSGSSFP